MKIGLIATLISIFTVVGGGVGFLISGQLSTYELEIARKKYDAKIDVLINPA